MGIVWDNTIGINNMGIIWEYDYGNIVGKSSMRISWEYDGNDMGIILES